MRLLGLQLLELALRLESGYGLLLYAPGPGTARCKVWRSGTSDLPLLHQGSPWQGGGRGLLDKGGGGREIFHFTWRGAKTTVVIIIKVQVIKSSFQLLCELCVYPPSLLPMSNEQ